MVLLASATTNAEVPSTEETELRIAIWETELSVIPTDRLEEAMEWARSKEDGYRITPREVRAAYNRHASAPPEEDEEDEEWERERAETNARLAAFGIEPYDPQKYPPGSPEHKEWWANQNRLLDEYLRKTGALGEDEPPLREDAGWA